MSKRKSPVVTFTVTHNLRHSIWEEAARLKMTPSRWMRETLQDCLAWSADVPTPSEYVIALTREEYQRLRKEGIRVSCKPLPEEE